MQTGGGKVANSPTGTLSPEQRLREAANKAVGSNNKSKIIVESGAGKLPLGGTNGNLPLDPKGTVKLNPQPAPAGRVTGIAVDPSDPKLKQTGEVQKTRPLAVSKNGFPYIGAGPDLKQTAAAKDDTLDALLKAKTRGDLSRQLKEFKIAENEPARPQGRVDLAGLTLDKVSGVHQDRLAQPDTFQHWQQTSVGQTLGLQQQFEFQRQGDLSRRLNLGSNLINAGGWAKKRQYGVIAAGFTSSAFSDWYAGGGCFPAHSWSPNWSPWVDWSYWNTCPVLYDPRPSFCIPLVYQPCLPWVYYGYPVWLTLPVVSCGTWIDVSPIIVTGGLDLQLLAVRFVDNGHKDQNLGPRYRVWVRNNSSLPIETPFGVVLLASNEQTPTVELPQSGVVVPSINAGEIQALDIRLPLAANRLGATPEGYRVPFNYLHVLVDGHQQIPETYEENNGAVVLRREILSVDPAAFSTDTTAAAPEGMLIVAGEGLGPEQGQVIVSVYGQQVQAEIHGWYDLGVRFAVPNFELTQPVDAEILIVRGDAAVANPLAVRLAPRELLEEVAVIPEAPLPNSAR